VLVGQRLHISHDHPLIRSWGIRHEKRFDVDEGLYQHCVKKLLVGYLPRSAAPHAARASRAAAPRRPA
jgi:hypothetical protein